MPISLACLQEVLHRFGAPNNTSTDPNASIPNPNANPFENSTSNVPRTTPSARSRQANAWIHHQRSLLSLHERTIPQRRDLLAKQILKRPGLIQREKKRGLAVRSTASHTGFLDCETRHTLGYGDRPTTVIHQIIPHDYYPNEGLKRLSRSRGTGVDPSTMGLSQPSLTYNCQHIP